MEYDTLKEVIERLCDFEEFKRINITDGIVNETYIIEGSFIKGELSEDVEILLEEPIKSIWGAGSVLYVEIK